MVTGLLRDAVSDGSRMALGPPRSPSPGSGFAISELTDGKRFRNGLTDPISVIIQTTPLNWKTSP